MFGAQLLLALSTLTGARLFEKAVPIALAFAAFSVFGCYAALTKFALPRSSQEQQEQANQVSPLVMIACAIVAIVGFVPNTQLTLCPSGLLLTISLCFLVGRLDSRLVGTPPYLVTALYLNALLYPLSCVLPIIDSSLAAAAPPTTMTVPLAHHVGAAMMTRLVSIPLTVVLFVVVLWTVQGRALERYLLNVERVARGVPRRGFVEAAKDVWARRPRLDGKDAK